MKKLLLILMMVSFAGVSTAQVSHVKGYGAYSCGFAISDTRDNEIAELAYKSWMLGYISALNFERISSKGKGIDANALWYAVMNRCRAKPLTYFDDAIYWVYRNELTE